jgi:hypothetical protein
MPCIVEGCENTKTIAKSLCSKHYHRQHRYGNTSFSKQNKQPPKQCIAIGCDRKPKAKSLCEAHYARLKRKSPSFNQGQIRSNKRYSPDDICFIPRCNYAPHSLGMCKRHYGQQHKHKLDFGKIAPLFEAGCQTCGSLYNLSIDHDHSICKEPFACEKCFRGILCGPCNRALGIVQDNPNILKNMINYVQNKIVIKT